jgi:hypothetical protein
MRNLQMTVYRRGHNPGNSAAKRNSAGQIVSRIDGFGCATAFATMDDGTQQRREAMESAADDFGRLCGQFAIRASIRYLKIGEDVKSALLAELMSTQLEDDKGNPRFQGGKPLFPTLHNAKQELPSWVTAYATREYNENSKWRSLLWETYGIPYAKRYMRMYAKRIEVKAAQSVVSRMRRAIDAGFAGSILSVDDARRMEKRNKRKPLGNGPAAQQLNNLLSNLPE